MTSSLKLLFVFNYVLIALLLSGCVAAAVGAGATTGVVVAQERSAGDAVDDLVISTEIKHLYLNKNAYDLFSGVSVEVIEGRVHLTGKVKKPETRIDAVRLAWQPKGVKEVINEIQVTDKSSTISSIAKDKWIVAQLDTKLLLSSKVLSFNYSTDVVNNVVYIMGIAKSEEELDEVISIAQKIKGVKKVITHVRMRDETE